VALRPRCGRGCDELRAESGSDGTRTVIGGALLLAIGSGLAILRGARLPKWLAWVAIVLGIAALIPPASFPSLLGFAIWSVIVSIRIYTRTGGVQKPAADAPMMAAAG
jgi:hypothetical protein